MRLVSWVLVLWLVVVATASAQSTGSSAGGSSWGSAGSSGSSSSGSSSWSSSGGGSSDVPGGPAYEPPVWGQCLIAGAFFLFLFLVFRAISRASAPPRIGVVSVQVAIDARARRFVQAALAKMVAEGDTRSRVGLQKLLASATQALVASKLAWIYVGSTHEAPALAPQARSTHTRLAQDARSRFQTELVRKSEGETTTADAPTLTAREHEGEGVVVVTLVVAATRAIPTAGASAAEIEGLVTALGKLSHTELIALEVVWSPAAENDRMSTVELEARYPELVRLPGRALGRVFCAFCGGPFAAELSKCPHCGAPKA